MTSARLILLIAAGLALQTGLFLGLQFWRQWRSYRRLEEGQHIATDPAASVLRNDDRAPQGSFRPFKVVNRVIEDAAGQICSFYLAPEDGQPLPPYKPGQFLTFRLDVPTTAGTAPITRCYSLSDAPRPDHYRVSIKRVPSPPASDLPPGRSSNFFHDQVQTGATLQVRAPSGHFHLEPGDSPVVLIAGGIGITPMLSMLNWCQAHQPEREVWLFYGVRNSREVAFAPQLHAAAAAANPRFHLRLCFSNPLPEDMPGQDFHHRGRVTVNLLRMELPLKAHDYFLCGPTAMLESLVPALEDWGVPDSLIHFEAFGPASIPRRHAQVAESGDAASVGDITVTFARSGKQARWAPASGSLLEFAEAQGVAIDSGCRAGSCGSCQTSVQSGEVVYRQAPDYEPEPGTCLMCICTPGTDLTLEA